MDRFLGDGGDPMETQTPQMKQRTKRKAEKVKTGDKAADKLYEAACDYVESRGGSAVVVGGIQVIQMPDDLEFNWVLGVRITGRKPKLNPKRNV